MTDHDELGSALRDYASPVTPPPDGARVVLDALDRRRRRRTTTTAAVATLVLVLGVGTAVGATRGGPDRSGGPATTADPPSAAPTPAETDTTPVDAAPVGFTYVASGRIAVAVPEDWARDAVGCDAVPLRTTVLVGTSPAVCYRTPRPFPTDSDVVELQEAIPVVTGTGDDWEPVVVDGVDALRSPTVTELGDPSTTRASIAFPDDGVVITATSSNDPTRVEMLLDRVVVLDDHVGVPAFADLASVGHHGRGDRDRMDEAYLARLRQVGLDVRVVEQADDGNLPAHRVLSVSPAAGTVVRPGATVTVTVSG